MAGFKLEATRKDNPVTLEWKDGKFKATPLAFRVAVKTSLVIASAGVIVGDSPMNSASQHHVKHPETFIHLILKGCEYTDPLVDKDSAVIVRDYEPEQLPIGAIS